ncbi:MAG TPA: hypothetical protein VFE50_15455, partial [Cyclobacteriaceae bacterium]|nr:hypothetical protein [Cyclobacteriaceae bacterium]
MKKRAMRYLAIAFLMPLFVGVMSCKNEADPEADKRFFTRFYDDNSFNVAYTPLDAAQTSDGGYLILALKRTVDLTGQDVTPGRIYVLKTNAFGDFISDETLDENLGQPAPSLMTVGGKFYFFCMQMDNFSIQLMEVGEDGRIDQQLNVGGAYPLAAGVDGNNMMLLHFDPGARTTIMSVVAPSGHIEKTKGFNIGAAD